MENNEKTITLDPESELARILSETDAETTPVTLNSNGVQYVVKRKSDDIFANYDPERVRRALHLNAGTLRGVDIEELKRELREQRAQDSSGGRLESGRSKALDAYVRESIP